MRLRPAIRRHRDGWRTALREDLPQLRSALQLQTPHHRVRELIALSLHNRHAAALSNARLPRCCMFRRRKYIAEVALRGGEQVSRIFRVGGDALITHHRIPSGRSLYCKLLTRRAPHDRSRKNTKPEVA